MTDDCETSLRLIICPPSFQSSMLRHKYVEHDKKHQCEHCGFCCGSKRELGLHMTKHEEAKFQGRHSIGRKVARILATYGASIYDVRTKGGGGLAQKKM